MSTNSEIIQDALQEVGILAAGESAPAEDFMLALRRLNQMMEQWREEGIELGWFEQSVLSDTAPIPKWAERAVYSNLAVHLCPSFQVPVRPELVAIASDAYNAVLSRVLNMRLQGVDMSHLAFGSGRFDGDVSVE